MGEQVRAFVPGPLPPVNPPLALRGPVGELHAGALAALPRLAVAGTMVPRRFQSQNDSARHPGASGSVP